MGGSPLPTQVLETTPDHDSKATSKETHFVQGLIPHVAPPPTKKHSTNIQRKATSGSMFYPETWECMQVGGMVGGVPSVPFPSKLPSKLKTSWFDKLKQLKHRRI